MSGHSKWAQIKRQKGAADNKRGALYTKLANVIALATREGGSKDPSMNVRLRFAIDKAKSVNMPGNTIERAIARGAGELGGSIMESVLYEGFGPGGCAVLVEGATDNTNRTLGDVRLVFTKFGGRLGSSGSVQWMFEQRGSIATPSPISDEVELSLIDSGAVDIIRDDSGTTEILTKPTELEQLRTAAANLGLAIESAELVMLPKTVQKLSQQEFEQVVAMTDALEEIDGVTSVTTNAESDN